MSSKVQLILGPPGTGKTTKLMSILTEELKTTPSTRIGFVTFTREGANQGITRAVETTGLSKDSFPFFRTLHSLAFKQAEMVRDRLMSRTHYKELSKSLDMNFLGHYSEELKNDDDRYLFLYDLERNNKEYFETKALTIESYKYKHVKINYPRYKKMYGLYDYTDLIIEYLNIGEPCPVDKVFLDEAQDLTPLQWKMFWKAFGHCKKIYIAGDDDQSIFQWSGASLDDFMSVKGEKVILDKSYRLPDEILEYSKKVTKLITKRFEKDYHGTGPGGKVIHLGSVYQLPKISTGESWLLLSRNNSYLSNYEEILQQSGCFYHIKGDPSIRAKDISVLEVFRKHENGMTIRPEDEFLLKEECNSRFDINKGWEKCVKWSPIKVEYIKQWLRIGMGTTPGVRVNTIHTSKGAEADNVVVLLDISSRVNKNFEEDPDSEHRAFYVAFTRARKNLYVIRSNTRHEYTI